MSTIATGLRRPAVPIKILALAVALACLPPSARVIAQETYAPRGPILIEPLLDPPAEAIQEYIPYRPILKDVPIQLPFRALAGMKIR